MTAPLLELEAVTMQFGGLRCVSDFSLSVCENELIGLIGPNGAGKTTVFNLVTGVYRPTAGKISFAGKSVIGHRPYRITARGIARTFQNIRLFSSLSVFDNVRTACNMHLHHGLSHALLRGRGFDREEREIEDQITELLEIFGLSGERDLSCRALPYGDQRRLEIVRALATRPKLLLLDEPAAGMNPTEKIELMKLIRFTQGKFGLAVLLVEHDMRVVMGICERIAVLDYGKKIAEGTAQEIRHNPMVIAAYLGRKLMLEILDLEVCYGSITALQGVSAKVEKGTIVTLVGANGAGKTTTLRAISGVIKARSGKISFNGEEITNKPPHKIVARGIAQCPEGRMVFANLTVLENLKMGAYLRRDKAGIANDLEFVFGIFPRLQERQKQTAGTLSGGEQQMLAIGRALMSKPKCLMLDEPSLGIAPILVQTIFDKIVEINKALGITILLVEQNANLALEISHYGYVLETGRVLLHDRSAALRENEEIRAAYLGG